MTYMMRKFIPVDGGYCDDKLASIL